MGVESGDDIGLSNMNKRIEAETHLRAGEILKRLGLSFDFGFMLLDPWSTFESVRSNIAFLERFVGDGWSVAPFCRMLPYAGTPLEAPARRSGTAARHHLRSRLPLPRSAPRSLLRLDAGHLPHAQLHDGRAVPPAPVLAVRGPAPSAGREPDHGRGPRLPAVH